MLTGINLFSSKPSTKTIEAPKQNNTQSISANNSYVLPSRVMFAGRLDAVPSKYQMEFGVEFDRNQRRAEKVEEEGLFFSAKKQYKQNFKKLEKYIEQESKKGPITDLKVLNDLTRVTDCLCSNLGALCEVSLAKKYSARAYKLGLEKFSTSINSPEEKYLDTIVKIHEVLNPEFCAGEDEDITDLSGLVEDTEDPQVNPNDDEPDEFEVASSDIEREETSFDKDPEDEGWVNMGNVYIRKVLDQEGKEQYFTDVVPNMQFKDTIVSVPPKKLAIMLKEQKDIIEKIAPDKVSRSFNSFNPVLDEAIDKYHDLSLFLAGSQLKEKNIVQARQTLEVLENYLTQKDSTKIYWDEDEIVKKRLEINEIGETTPIDDAEEESIETIEANIGARDLSNSDMLRVECLQTLAKEKSFSTLANIAVSNIDKLATKYSIQLLVNANDEKAKKMLDKVLVNLPDGQDKEDLGKKLGKSKGDISFTGSVNSGYDILKVDDQLEKAKKIEERGYFFDAGKLYKKAWTYTVDYIKTSEKYDTPIDPIVLTFLRNSTELLCQNLCARGKISSASNYANAAHRKLNDNIVIDETRHDSENFFNAERLKASQNMANTLSDGKSIYREIEFHGKLERLIDLVKNRQKYKDVVVSVSEPINLDFAEVSNIIQNDKNNINMYVKTNVKQDDYNPEISEVFESFIDASASAINMLREKGCNEKTSKASELLSETIEFLKTKDPYNVYWDKEQFEVIKASLNETEKATFEDLTQGYPDDIEVIEAVLASKDKTLKPSQRVEFMEKLGKLKAYEKLAEISLANIDNYSNNAPIYLLAKVGTTDSARALQSIINRHENEEVRKTAAEKLSQEYYKL